MLFHDLKKFLIHKHRTEVLYREQLTQNKGKQIQHWNWWSENARTMLWLQDFIVKRGLVDSSGKKIALCSIFGEREVLDRVEADVRILFSGENLRHPHRAQYADYMLSNKNPFDLSLGFDVFESEHYLRFPLWLAYMFAPDATKEDISKRCAELCHPVLTERNKCCALVARVDKNGVRTKMYESISGLGRVDCPSALFHNDDGLKEQYHDDKIAYLRQFKFNICPENSSSYGYTTEKLFESVAAGCIPIYWGNDCLDIINPAIVLFWDRESDNQVLLDRMTTLMTDDRQYRDFITQDWLVPDAEDFVIGKFTELETKLNRLLH